MSRRIGGEPDEADYGFRHKGPAYYRRWSLGLCLSGAAVAIASIVVSLAGC